MNGANSSAKDYDMVVIDSGAARHHDVRCRLSTWTFPLSRQAVEILLELKPLTGSGRFVFPSARSKERPMSDNAILAAMRRAGIEKDEMSGHGYRAVARTILNELLGHSA